MRKHIRKSKTFVMTWKVSFDYSLISMKSLSFQQVIDWKIIVFKSWQWSRCLSLPIISSCCFNDDLVCFGLEKCWLMTLKVPVLKVFWCWWAPLGRVKWPTETKTIKQDLTTWVALTSLTPSEQHFRLDTFQFQSQFGFVNLKTLAFVSFQTPFIQSSLAIVTALLFKSMLGMF